MTDLDRSESAGLLLSHNQFRSIDAVLYPVGSQHFSVIIRAEMMGTTWLLIYAVEVERELRAGRLGAFAGLGMHGRIPRELR